MQIFFRNHEGFVICNVLLEEKDRFFSPIYRKQETKVTFVNHSELIARPFVPSAQFSSFVPFCHSRGTSSFFYQFSLCIGSFLSFARVLSSSRSTPDITVSLLFFASEGSLFSMVAKETAVLLWERNVGTFAKHTDHFA